jgi:flavin-dependent dehydrogenase
MASAEYDVIVVGAQCAGSPTAMLLARQGYRVLLVDRAAFPSDTLSTHLIQPTGVASLRQWGLLDQVVASGCPAIVTYAFDFGPLSLAGSPGTPDSPVAYAPRRTVLDELLVQAAAVAGVEVREAFTVTEVLVEDARVVGIRGHGQDGVVVAEHARIVVGADGRRSVVAAVTSPEQYHEPPVQRSDGSLPTDPRRAGATDV